jgi:hypothetical protein
MNIDIGHGPQEERGAHVGIDREAEADVDVIDPEVKHFFIFFIFYIFYFLYILLFNCFLFLLKK